MRHRVRLTGRGTSVNTALFRQLTPEKRILMLGDDCRAWNKRYSNELWLGAVLFQISTVARFLNSARVALIMAGACRKVGPCSVSIFLITIISFKFERLPVPE